MELTSTGLASERRSASDHGLNQYRHLSLSLFLPPHFCLAWLSAFPPTGALDTAEPRPSLCGAFPQPGSALPPRLWKPLAVEHIRPTALLEPRSSAVSSWHSLPGPMSQDVPSDHPQLPPSGGSPNCSGRTGMEMESKARTPPWPSLGWAPSAYKSGFTILHFWPSCGWKN